MILTGLLNFLFVRIRNTAKDTIAVAHRFF